MGKLNRVLTKNEIRNLNEVGFKFAKKEMSYGEKGKAVVLDSFCELGSVFVLVRIDVKGSRGDTIRFYRVAEVTTGGPLAFEESTRSAAMEKIRRELDWLVDKYGLEVATQKMNGAVAPLPVVNEIKS